MRFETFRSSMRSWDALLEEAAQFASKQGPARVISASHSSDSSDGLVTIWYREGAPQRPGTLRFQTFRSAMKRWDRLMAEATQFVPPGKVLGVSHSADSGDGLIVVWYWA